MVFLIIKENYFLRPEKNTYVFPINYKFPVVNSKGLPNVSQGHHHREFSIVSSGGHIPPNMAMQTGTSNDVQLRTNSQLIRSNRDSLDRKDSIMTDPGREGQELEGGSGIGRAIGVFTSGGDSQGMSIHNKIHGHSYFN